MGTYILHDGTKYISMQSLTENILEWEYLKAHLKYGSEVFGEMETCVREAKFWTLTE